VADLQGTRACKSCNRKGTVRKRVVGTNRRQRAFTFGEFAL
jgi:hypothetical protein